MDSDLQSMLIKVLYRCVVRIVSDPKYNEDGISEKGESIHTYVVMGGGVCFRPIYY